MRIFPFTATYTAGRRCTSELTPGILLKPRTRKETEALIRRLPREHHLELRTIIDRHISLARVQPLEIRQTALDEVKPKQEGLDLNYLIKKLKS